MLGALAAAVGGKLVDTFLNRQNADMQNDATIQMARDMPSAQMEGLRNAGLNPMLAINKLNLPASSAPIASAGDIASNVAALQSSAASAKQAETATTQMEANVDKIVQEIENLKTSNDQAKALIENLRVTYDNLVKEGWNLTEVGNNLRATHREIMARVGVQTEDQIYKAFDNVLMEYAVRAAKQMDGLGQSAGQLKPFFDLIRSIVIPARGK